MLFLLWHCIKAGSLVTGSEKRALVAQNWFPPFCYRVIGHKLLSRMVLESCLDLKPFLSYDHFHTISSNYAWGRKRRKMLPKFVIDECLILFTWNFMTCTWWHPNSIICTTWRRTLDWSISLAFRSTLDEAVLCHTCLTVITKGKEFMEHLSEGMFASL